MFSAPSTRMRNIAVARHQRTKRTRREAIRRSGSISVLSCVGCITNTGITRGHAKRRHECRRGRHECPMPLSYRFLAVAERGFGSDFAFGERTGARPDFARIRTARAPWEFRLTEYPEHLAHDLLAVPFVLGACEQRQEGM